MARPQRRRRICAMPEHTAFIPENGAAGEIVLSIDEYEALRLMDREGCTHEECAEIMQVSRTTATEIYASARRKIASAIVDGLKVLIEGGSIQICDHKEPCGRPFCTVLPGNDEYKECAAENA